MFLEYETKTSLQYYVGKEIFKFLITQITTKE
jgi:hypothetical protein